MDIRSIDSAIIGWLQRVFVPAARFALFMIFFWFGALKLLGLSPAGPLVESLFYRTISWIQFPAFYTGFALFECLIGVLFLIPRATRLVIPLLALHMATTFLPLVFLPRATWQAFLVPTLEGQYIIKNLVIIAAAIGITAHLTPMREAPRS